MPKVKGANTLSALPVSAAPGAVTSLGSQKLTVPVPSALTINGATTPIIDVRAMSAGSIAQSINAMGIAVTAIVEDGGNLSIENVKTLSGDPVLRAFLGI